jgi:aminoglycoside phosphotransferase
MIGTFMKSKKIISVLPGMSTAETIKKNDQKRLQDYTAALLKHCHNLDLGENQYSS